MRYPDIVAKDGEGWADHKNRLLGHEKSKKRSKGLTYEVFAQVLNAADYGIPQKRERVFFVGFRSDVGATWEFPSPTHSAEALLWEQCRSMEYWDRHEVHNGARILSDQWYAKGSQILLQPRLKPWRTVRDAIGSLPDPELQRSASKKLINHKFQPGARSYKGHTGSALDQPAKALKAGVHGVPGGENMLLKPDGTVRYFTIRESARLQTFPDGMRFEGAWSEAMRQLGNAVPARLAEIISRDIARELNKSIECPRQSRTDRSANGRRSIPIQSTGSKKPRRKRRASNAGAAHVPA